MNMPFLNWKERPIQQSIEALASGVTGWSMTFNREELEELVAGLGAVLESTSQASEAESMALVGVELRLTLSGESAIFWKLHAGGSKLLIARPEEGRWVATLSLERSHFQRVVDRLRVLSEGERLAVGELGDDIHPVSNLEFMISLTL
jgi:hypothetical protein